MSREGGQMDQKPVYRRPHYHIRWKYEPTLDWQCFHSYSDAYTLAAQLAKPHESFTIDEVSSECPFSGVSPLRQVSSSKIGRGL
jgi:hypothetical protein